MRCSGGQLTFGRGRGLEEGSGSFPLLRMAEGGGGALNCMGGGLPGRLLFSLRNRGGQRRGTQKDGRGGEELARLLR